MKWGWSGGDKQRVYREWSLAPINVSAMVGRGPSVNKEYLSQIQLYSIFRELPVLSNTVLIITICVKVANSTF